MQLPLHRDTGNEIVERYIGTAYDKVKSIADNISSVTAVADTLDTIVEVAQVIPTFQTVGDNITSIINVGDSISDVIAVSTDLAAVNAVSSDLTRVNLVADNLTNIDVVADNVTDVIAVGQNITDVNTVASMQSDIAAVVADEADIGIVSDNITQVVAVGDNIADVINVSGMDSDLTAVLGNQFNINLVADDIANVNAVGGNISDVITVAGISTSDLATVSAAAAEVVTVAGISTDVVAVAGNASDITGVRMNLGSINTVAGAETAVNFVANNISSVNGVFAVIPELTTVAGIAADVSTVAGIAPDVTAVANAIPAINVVNNQATEIQTVSDNIATLAAAASLITLINTEIVLTLGSTEVPESVYTNITDAVNYGKTQLQQGGTIILEIPSGTFNITEPSSVVVDGFNLDIRYDVPTSDNSLRNLNVGVSQSSGPLFSVVKNSTLNLTGITLTCNRAAEIIEADNSTVNVSCRLNKTSLGQDMIIGRNNSYIKSSGAYFFKGSSFSANAMVGILLFSSRADVDNTTFEPTDDDGPNANIAVHARRMSTVVIESNGVNAFYDDSVAPAYIAVAREGSTIFIPGQVGGEVNGFTSPVTTSGFTNPYSPALNVTGNVGATILR